MTDVKNKIAKLLRLSKSPNANEAAAALAKANELMQEHNITFKQVEASEYVWEKGIKAYAKPPKFELRLVNIIRDAFGVYTCIKMSRNPKNKKMNTYEIFGLPHRVEWAKYALIMAKEAVQKARADFLKNCESTNVPVRLAKADAFCLGYVEAIGAALQNLYPANAAECQKAKEIIHSTTKIGKPIHGAQSRLSKHMDQSLQMGVAAGAKFRIFQPCEGGGAVKAPLALGS